MEDYSLGLQWSLVELVRSSMRQLAQSGKVLEHSKLLKAAIEETRTEIQERLQKRGVEFDFDDYFDIVGRTLAFPAKEMSQLGVQLGKSRKSNRIGERQKFLSEAQIPFEVVEIGLRNAIEGLVAFPLARECVLDLERIKQDYRVEGEWCPLGVSTDNLKFVVDDDGTISISLKNSSETAVKEATEVLIALASQVYVGN
ncbi:hypothetical protein H6F93_01120 [Leptolyngbya sp. FACHB-671]|uniref:hypothetical protein n=1 Tax=Leptolyngbya sp. FACHB-671 TaxID=2692812 RepID=UPI001682A74A|nr:hypothetical protein [Leptolyngbya sp. FACHB-671]MBD2066141.1 hypothetical protein [Leptolyngbya sp. FACHB-671]